MPVPYASTQKYPIVLNPIASNQHGTVEVKNANNQTVTEAAEGEVLHLSVTPDAGYAADAYSLYYGAYNNGATISNRPINQTFTMPAQNIWYTE